MRLYGGIDLHSNNSSLVIFGNNVTNTGTLEGKGGQLVLNHGTYTNTGGTIGAQNGSSVVLTSAKVAGGNLTTAGTGVVTLDNGWLDNATITSGSKVEVKNQSYGYVSGTLTNNGTIALNSSSTLGPANLLVGDKNSGSPQTVTFTGTGAVVMNDHPMNNISALSGSTLVNDTNHTIQGSGGIGSIITSIAFVNKGTLVADQAAGITVFADSQGLQNQGNVRVEAGSQLNVPSAAYVQSSGLTTVNGLLRANLIEIDGGILNGTGKILGDVNMNGTAEPGLSPGTLTIDGKYSQTHNGILSMELGTSYDKLIISGLASFDGTLDIKLLAGFVPTDEQVFELLQYASRIGDFDQITGLDPNGPLFFTYDGGSDKFTLTAHYDTSNTVPEPGTLLLLGLGLIGLVGMRRVKK